METFEVDQYIQNPTHPLTVAVIGAGATGSLVMTKLARMNVAYNSLRENSLAVCHYERDLVEHHNLGKQLFMPAEIGMGKAAATVTRLNRFFSFGWNAKLSFIEADDELAYNIVISCTDTVESRRAIQKAIYNGKNRNTGEEGKFLYWIDCGNAAYTGNVIMTDLDQLPSIFDLHPDLEKHEKKQEPSCSLAESLSRQSLFVNDYTADIAALLFWELITKKQMNWYGAYFNINTLKIQKLMYEQSKIQAAKERGRNYQNKRKQKDSKAVGRTSTGRIRRRSLRSE